MARNACARRQIRRGHGLAQARFAHKSPQQDQRILAVLREGTVDWLNHDNVSLTSHYASPVLLISQFIPKL
ncbi:MAG TPA: hypothetical protein PL140_00155 [Ferrovaceae bacterium]|nr:hypothetical protein [Ferrovaceae bacterium]